MSGNIDEQKILEQLDLMDAHNKAASDIAAKLRRQIEGKSSAKGSSSPRKGLSAEQRAKLTARQLKTVDKNIRKNKAA